MAYDYQKICQDLIKDLPPKQKEVVLRRFGLLNKESNESAPERETLESIGKSFGITRERVRQIEATSLKDMEPKLKKYKAIFRDFKKYFQKFGGVRKEKTLFEELGEKKWQNQAYFLLNLGQGFMRFGENRDFWSSWCLSRDSLSQAKRTVETLSQKLEKFQKPFAIKNLASVVSLRPPVLESWLEISKKIQRNGEGFYGLRTWPEINPRGIKDKAFLAFRKVKKPLHFTEVSQLIEGSLVQTVHNELIRDPRFVLVGRGVYALKEWGYAPGQVKDVISSTIKEEGRPLSREEILEKVLKQRMVKENTIFLNLSNKKYFSKDSQGKYWIREA
ncbi:MAG: sigma factor-like helix-turn-helix DNA-binding protein [bacterium]|nr:sigma factor-like helix-turn-helix DNA-binding protein [bacterium]